MWSANVRGMVRRSGGATQQQRANAQRGWQNLMKLERRRDLLTSQLARTQTEPDSLSIDVVCGYLSKCA